jgi:hypothetical protein
MRGRWVSTVAEINPLSWTPRVCAPIGAARLEGHAYKVYVVRSPANANAICPSTADLARAIATESADWATLPTDHGLGFAILHLADDGWYLLMSRFENANNLRHRVRALVYGPGGICTVPLGDSSIIACVWEMRLMQRECDVWIDTILKAGAEVISPSMAEAYLTNVYEGPV